MRQDSCTENRFQSFVTNITDIHMGDIGHVVFEVFDEQNQDFKI